MNFVNGCIGLVFYRSAQDERWLALRSTHLRGLVRADGQQLSAVASLIESGALPPALDTVFAFQDTHNT